MHYVYVLLSEKDKNLYIGLTQDVNNRCSEHKKGSVISTKNRRPLELIYYEAYVEKLDAFGREKFLKSGSGHRYIKKQLKHFFEKKDNTRGT